MSLELHSECAPFVCTWLPPFLLILAFAGLYISTDSGSQVSFVGPEDVPVSASR